MQKKPHSEEVKGENRSYARGERGALDLYLFSIAKQIIYHSIVIPRFLNPSSPSRHHTLSTPSHIDLFRLSLLYPLPPFYLLLLPFHSSHSYSSPCPPLFTSLLIRSTLSSQSHLILSHPASPHPINHFLSFPCPPHPFLSPLLIIHLLLFSTLHVPFTCLAFL